MTEARLKKALLQSNGCKIERSADETQIADRLNIKFASEE
jgi:hypothetical protein